MIEPMQITTPEQYIQAFALEGMLDDIVNHWDALPEGLTMQDCEDQLRTLKLALDNYTI